MNQKPLRMILTAEQTAALADNARFAVCIIHPGSWPDHPDRRILDLIEVADAATANAAVGVALGTHTARRKPTKP